MSLEERQTRGGRLPELLSCSSKHRRESGKATEGTASSHRAVTKTSPKSLEDHNVSVKLRKSHFNLLVSMEWRSIGA